MGEKEMKKINLIQATMAIGILIIALSVAYYLLIFIPKNEQAKQEQRKLEIINQTEKEKLKKDAYNTCIKNAHTAYISEWSNNCEGEVKESGCSMSTEKRNAFTDAYEKNKDRCVTLYK